MVRQLKPENVVKEVKHFIKGVENLDKKTGAIIKRSEMAIHRLEGAPDTNYIEILKTNIRPDNEELYRDLKRAPNKRAFKKLTKCTLSDMVKYGLAVLEEEIFSDDFLQRLETRYKKESEFRIRENEKYPDKVEKWTNDFSKWERILEETPESKAEPPDPPKEPKPILDDDLDPMEWLVQTLGENGIKFDETFEQALIEGIIPDETKIRSAQQIDFCSTFDFNKTYEIYPEVAKKILTNDLRKRRKARSRKLTGRDLFVKDYIEKTGSTIMTAQDAWKVLESTEIAFWNNFSEKYN